MGFSGDKLRKARMDRGWSCKNVADRIGLPDANTVSRWERGVNFPSPHYRQKLSKLYGKSLTELGLDGGGHEGPERHSIFPSLPYVPGSFIGRQADVDRIVHLLTSQDEEIRLLTLTGVGGVGKTRLVIKVAEQMKHYAFIPCFVDLTLCDNSDRVVTIIAEALKLHVNMETPLLQQVKTRLEDEKVLLVLDNFEHVIGAAPIIVDLVHSCPHCIIIVTSRQILNLDAEYPYPVQSLELPEKDHLLSLEKLSEVPAVALFLDVMGRRKVPFSLNAKNAEAVVEICRLLGGLPLAIKLAAAKIPLFTPQELLEHLLQDLHILKSDYADIPERQRTLEAMVQWSYKLLTPDEQWLFRRLALFAGMALPIIEKFVRMQHREDIDVYEVVSSLEQKNLLHVFEVDDERRFFMQENLRFWAREYLRGEQEEESAFHIYALCYLQFIEEVLSDLTGPKQCMMLKHLDAEFDNLRVALEWFISHAEAECALRFADAFGKFCGLYGYWREEWRLLDAVLDLPGVSDYPRLWARVLRRLAHLRYRLRSLSASFELFKQSEELSRDAGDTVNLVGSLTGQVRIASRKGEIQKAESLMHEALKLARQSKDDWCIGNTLECYGSFKMAQGEFGEAESLLQEAEEVLVGISDIESMTRVLTAFVRLDIARGNIEQAKTHAQRSNEFAHQLDTKPLIGVTLDSLSEVSLFRGDYKQARDRMQERITLASELGDVSTVEVQQIRLLEIESTEKNDLTEMIVLVEQSLSRLRAMGDPQGVIIARGIIGDLQRRSSRFVQASDNYRKVLVDYRESAGRKQLGHALLGLALICVAQERYECAAKIFGTTESYLRPLTDMHPAQHLEYRQARERAASQLGKTRFSDCWSSFSQSSLDDVLNIFDQ